MSVYNHCATEVVLFIKLGTNEVSCSQNDVCLLPFPRKGKNVHNPVQAKRSSG